MSVSARNILGLVRKYSPDEARDYHGRWTSGGNMGELQGVNPAADDAGNYGDWTKVHDKAKEQADALSAPITKKVLQPYKTMGEAQGLPKEVFEPDYPLDSVDTKKFINATLATDISKALATDPKLAAWADREMKNLAGGQDFAAAWISRVGYDSEASHKLWQAAHDKWENEVFAWGDKVNAALGNTEKLPMKRADEFKVGDMVALGKDTISPRNAGDPFARLVEVVEVKEAHPSAGLSAAVNIAYLDTTPRHTDLKPGDEIAMDDIKVGDIVGPTKGRIHVATISKGYGSGWVEVRGEDEGSLSTGADSTTHYWGHEPVKQWFGANADEYMPAALTVEHRIIHPMALIETLGEYQNTTIPEITSLPEETAAIVDPGVRNMEYSAWVAAGRPKVTSTYTLAEQMALLDKLPQNPGPEPNPDETKYKVPMIPMPSDLRTIVIGDTVRKYIDTWAGSSGDSSPRSIALQRAVVTNFALPRTLLKPLEEFASAHTNTDMQLQEMLDQAGHKNMRGSDISAWHVSTGLLKHDRPFLNHFARAIYDNTQAELTKRGVGPHDHVLLKRGMHIDPLHAPRWAMPPLFSTIDNVGAPRFEDQPDVGVRPAFNTTIPQNRTIRLNPLSAWSSSLHQAENFKNMGETGERGFLISSYVPRERIFSLASSTGIGCLGEEEIIVIGGRGRATVKWDSNWNDAPTHDYGAYNASEKEKTYWANIAAKLKAGGKTAEAAEVEHAASQSIHENATTVQQTPASHVKVGDQFVYYGQQQIVDITKQPSGELKIDYVNVGDSSKGGTTYTIGGALPNYGYTPMEHSVAPPHKVPLMQTAYATKVGDIITFAPGGILYTVKGVKFSQPGGDVKLKVSTGQEFTVKAHQDVYLHGTDVPKAQTKIHTADFTMAGDIISLVPGGAKHTITTTEHLPNGKVILTTTAAAHLNLQGTDDVYFYGLDEKLIKAADDDDLVMDLDADPSDADWIKFLGNDVSLDGSVIVGSMTGLTVRKYSPDEERDYHGRWGSGGSPNPKTPTVPNNPAGQAAAAAAQAAQAQSTYDPKTNTVTTSDINDAVRALTFGQKVILNQPDEVSTLLDRLATIVDDATKKGAKAPSYNLCDVSVKGTNLFCAENVGKTRLTMPQLSGVPEPGSLADALPKNKKGEADLSSQFREALAGEGVTITDTTVPASHLRASQNELKGAQVAGMVRAMRPTKEHPKGLIPDKPIFVTADNYIIDGHHRWAAKVGLDLADNHLGDVDMPVTQIGMSILPVLVKAFEFAEEWGIKPKGITKAFRLMSLLRKYSTEQPRGPNGQWVLSTVRLEDAGSHDGDYCLPHGMQAKVAARKNGHTDAKVIYHRGLASDVDRFGRGAATAANPCKVCLRGGVDAVVKDYNPDEARDDHGRWTEGGGGGSTAQTILDRISSKPITADEARGNSRPVSAREFRALADVGRRMLSGFSSHSSPPTGITDNLPAIVDRAHAEASKSWGGLTVDTHTGVPIETDADLYALTVKSPGQNSVTIREGASLAEMDEAVREALSRFPQLGHAQHALGVFHDDERHRIDIDPVLIVKTPAEVEAIGAFTHAIGGAYHFASGNGYFPPHVGEKKTVAASVSAREGKRLKRRRGIEGRRVSAAEFFAQDRPFEDDPDDNPVTKMDPAPGDVHMPTTTEPKSKKKRRRRIGPFLLDLVKAYNEDELRDSQGRWTVGGGEHAPGPIRTYDHMDYFSATHQEKIRAAADKVGYHPRTAEHRLTALAERSTTPEHDGRWYYDRHDEVTSLAARTDLTTPQVTGIVAAMSPLNDWEKNWTDAITIAEQWKLNPTYTITQADHDAVVTYDLNSRIHKSAPTQLPIGTFHLRDMNPDHVVALSALRDIGLPRGINYRENMEKALTLAAGGRPDEVLSGPKVRSFYSNILEPADDQHVTVDTHMIRAMMDDPLMSSKLAQTMRGTPGAKKETGTDIGLGLYPLMADVIAKAAAKFEGGRYSPSEFQAIVWERWKVEHPPVERRENTKARIKAGEIKRGGFQQASQDRKRARKK